MEPHEKVHRSRKKMLLDNFLGGIAWSLGVTIGGALVIALFAFILSNVNYVPVVGDFVLNVADYISQNQRPFSQ